MNNITRISVFFTHCRRADIVMRTSVCLSLREHILETYSRLHKNFFMHAFSVTVARSSSDNNAITSGFVNNIIFSYYRVRTR